MKTRISAHAVSRSTIEDGNIQTKYGDFITESIDVQPYGFLHCVPDNAMSVVCRMEGDSAQRYALINYIPQVPYGLEAEEVALYSNHGQVLYCKEDGTLHLEAAGKISLHSDEEDLYSLLKDLIGVIKGLTTDKIDTKVNGGSVALAPSGTSPIAGAKGKNPGVGLSAESGDKLDKIAERLDKLLQKGEKPQSVEQQQQKKYEAQKKTLEDAQSDGSMDADDAKKQKTTHTVSDRKLIGRGEVTNKTSNNILGIDWDNRKVEIIKPGATSNSKTDTDFIVEGNLYIKVGAGKISYLGNGGYDRGIDIIPGNNPRFATQSEIEVINSILRENSIGVPKNDQA